MRTNNPYKNLPTFLYKYRYFDREEYQLQFLKDGSLFCSSPIKFNDPFDSFVKIDYSSATDSGILKKLERIIRHSQPDLSNGEVYKRVTNDFQSFDKRRLYDKDLHINIIIDQITNHFGVYSLSAAKNNILLWSHYAASHTGFLIEFNSLPLKNFLVNTYFPLKQKHALFEVHYSNKYASINAFSDNYDEELNKAFLTKAKEWSYEKEWRILYYGGANKSIKIPLSFLPDIVNCVILGYKISKPNEDELIALLQKHNIPIKKAIQSNEKFEMIYKDFK